MAYFNHTVDGMQLDLAHLEPRSLVFHVRNLGRDLAIDVKFSNHCFTVAFDAARHDPSQLVMDHQHRRAYDVERHRLSHNLPGMVDALPEASVHLTSSDRNYVYLANLQATDGRLYPMYFRLRRVPEETRRNLLMMVESAYPVIDRKRVLDGTTKISFAILCAKVFRGDRIRPQARR